MLWPQHQRDGRRRIQDVCAQADVGVGHFVATLGALGQAASGWPWVLPAASWTHAAVWHGSHWGSRRHNFILTSCWVVSAINIDFQCLIFFSTCTTDNLMSNFLQQSSSGNVFPHLINTSLNGYSSLMLL